MFVGVVFLGEGLDVGFGFGVVLGVLFGLCGLLLFLCFGNVV